jgi:acetylornithine deacetylase
MPLPDIELLGRLVAFDTTSDRSNIPLADFVCEYLDLPGVRLERFPSPDDRKVNLVIEAGPQPGSERDGLTLCGHMDVVPAGEGWTSDPFSLTRVGDRLVGRGTCDMKGFLAIAANLLAEATPGLHRPLALLFTYDEEVGTRGARHLAETWPDAKRLPRATIVGEPTGLRVVRAHKGIVELRVTVTGKSAHSGYPDLGRSAIEPAVRIAAALNELRERLAAERPAGHEDFPEVPFVPLNLGTIRGGTASNVVPDRCELSLTFRPLPGDDGAALTRRVSDTVRAAAADAPVEIAVTALSPAMATPVTALVMRELMAAAKEHDAVTGSYATDAGWLCRVGLDCAVYGPGDIALAHRADESVLIEDLERARRVLEQVIRRLCGWG